MTAYDHNLKGKRVLITGGLGMIGSTLARKSVQCGAKVTLVDLSVEPYGANLFNIHDIADSIQIKTADIRDKEAMGILVRDQNIVFNLAGQVSHNDSMENPFLDAEINYLGHLNVLECLRKNNPDAVVFHAGSRLQFGRIEKLPVDENHPLRPLSPYALNKTAAENMYLFYHRSHGISCVLFRIANPYGPRSQMRHNKYSILNWFVRLAMDDSTINIYGDGEQVRDYIYVDDLTEAFLAAYSNRECFGEVFNIGSGIGTKFKDMAESIIRIVGMGKIKYIPWPEDYVNIETGDYITDISKISKLTGWRPQITLEKGIQKVFEYYSKYKSYYW